MNPRPCFVLDGDDGHPGRVLTWRRDGDGPWRGLVEYRAPHESGAPLTFLHRREASEIRARSAT